MGQPVVGHRAGNSTGIGGFAGDHEACFLHQGQGVLAGGQRPGRDALGLAEGGESLVVESHQVDAPLGVVAQQLGVVVDIAGGIGIDHVGHAGHLLAIDVEAGGAHIAGHIHQRPIGAVGDIVRQE